MTELTFRDNHQVDSQRVLYTPSPFAKSCLMHLQETGTLKALSPHKSQRSNLASYLLFVVEDGEGQLEYEGKLHPLSAGNCVFIDCRKPYSHATSGKLWTLSWAHFDGITMGGIYQKYLERGGQPVFQSADVQKFLDLLHGLRLTAASGDHLRDMHINQQLSALLSLVMENSWRPGAQKHHPGGNKSLQAVKTYLDQNFHKKITLDDLAEQFYINKFYLTRLFREQYGSSVINYLLYLRISRAKELLRFTELSVEEIGAQCGMPDANYFSRAFRKIEGMSPSEFRKLW